MPRIARPFRFIPVLLVAVTLAAASGCGGNESSISAGTYVLTDEGIFPESLREATLQIEPGKAQGTLTLRLDQDNQDNQNGEDNQDDQDNQETGPSTDFQLTPRARSEWITGCDGAFTSADLETLDIEPDPLPIGDFALKNPVLTATCSGGSLDLRADPDNDAGDFTRSYRFTRRAQ